jgi:HPt (histidine-containing phosphotransfer) domain-containing protein
MLSPIGRAKAFMPPVHIELRRDAPPIAIATLLRINYDANSRWWPVSDRVTLSTSALQQRMMHHWEVSMSESMMAVESMPSPEVLDVEGTLARFGGDRELFAEMAAYLLEDAPRLSSDLQRAVAAKDATAVRMNAHALKGLLAGCGGVRASHAAGRLEDAGHAFDLSQASALLELLKSEVTLLMRALEPYRR